MIQYSRSGNPRLKTVEFSPCAEVSERAEEGKIRGSHTERGVSKARVGEILGAGGLFLPGRALEANSCPDGSVLLCPGSWTICS
jgi:hypothetical protein